MQVLCFAIVACLLLTLSIGVDARKNPKPPKASKPPPSPRAKRQNRKVSPFPEPTPTPSPTAKPEPEPEPTPDPEPEPTPEPSPELEIAKKSTSAGSDAIQLSQNGWGCEDNVCNAAGRCGGAARTEVLVAKPADAAGAASSETVWAPLCAAEALNETLQWALARVVCNQFNNWPSFQNFRQNPNGLASVFGWVEEPLLIPEAPEQDATDEYGNPLFDPRKYTHWATVTGWAEGVSPLDVRAVQDLPLTVSTTPCKEGRMLAVYCSMIVADHRRRQ